MTQPGLEDFFASMGRYLADPGEDAARAMIAEHPGWEPRLERLGIYAHHARVGLSGMLGKVFSGCRGALPAETWRGLMRDYYATRPADQYEINSAGAGFPAFVAGRAAELPPYLPALAAFEWEVLAVYQDPDELPERVEALTVNPSLQTCQHAWRLAAWLAREPHTGEPEPGEEIALIWRHPQTLRARYMSAGPRTLLALKLVHEQIPLERAAAEGGVTVEELQAVLEDAQTQGLLLAPQAL